MKILFILNMTNRVNNFSYASMLAAQSLGWEFYIAGNWKYESDEEREADEKRYGIKIYQVDFIREPYNPKNIRAYQQVLEILKKNKFDIIHCNTPIGGVIGRLAANKIHNKNIIYQVHGFHFYKGASWLNWLIYYPIEKWLARYTDTMITINQEDYRLAQNKMHLRNCGQIYYIPGVGIDLSKFEIDSLSRNRIRKNLGISADATVLISVGELNENKNLHVVIEAISKLKSGNFYYVICGVGPLEQSLKELCRRYDVEKKVLFLGYCENIQQILSASDIFILSSIREGLSRAVMEGMASHLPCIVSKIRGNVDLIDKEGGYLCDPNNSEEFYRALLALIDNKETRIKMGEYNSKKIMKFELSNVQKLLQTIYLGIQGD